MKSVGDDKVVKAPLYQPDLSGNTRILNAANCKISIPNNCTEELAQNVQLHLSQNNNNRTDYPI